MNRANHLHFTRRQFLRGVGTLGAVAVSSTLLNSCNKPSGDPTIPSPRYDPADRQWHRVADDRVKPLFKSVFLGGFECSTHYRRDAMRLDLVVSTRHDELAAADYQRLKSIGILACRDAARWHLIEKTPGYYDFSSLIPMAQAARSTGMQVIWDLMHYGWPDRVNVFAADFPERYGRYARAVARVLQDFTDPNQPLFVTPVNEISFLAWAGADNAYLNPYYRGRGREMKRQLIRAAIAAINAVREVSPTARLVHCDPLINVVARPLTFQRKAARQYRMAQFQAYDMLCGALHPALGGKPEYLDIIGCNYYRNNQTYFDGLFVDGESRDYMPLADLLEEVWLRYRRPMMLTETGIEDTERPVWMRYVAGEVAEAMQRGVPLHGVTWYPILDHPGWEDNRHCQNGLFSYADAHGQRQIYTPLAREIARQMPALDTLRHNAIQAAETTWLQPVAET